MRIEIFRGDITTLSTDAIVNAANRTLLGGGGVDGAIHRAAGPGLLAACRNLNGCATGEAKITGGFHLKANYVIHTVGPVWNDGLHGEPGLLRNCYRNSMKLAEQMGIGSIAFPNISTGVYGFPKQVAAEIAISAILGKKNSTRAVDLVIFAIFDSENFDIYTSMLK